MHGPVDKLSLPVDKLTAGDAWQRSLSEIQQSINPQTFQTWFVPIIPLSLDRLRLTVQVPSQFFYEWLEEHYAEDIRAALANVLGAGADIVYSVIQRQEDYGAPMPPFVSVKPSLGGVGVLRDESFLNSRYTFETFVEGKGNQFAKAASLAVAEAPGKTSFNPLVIYGGTGLGKTHLIQGIGNLSKDKNTAKRILYVSSEKFTIDFINAIQNNRTLEFGQMYRNVDLLIVDDIHFFLSKERTQEEFFHTFNTLHQKGKQIVLSSDRPPKELKGLEERLVSRFQWGLVTEIQPPDLETRIAILQQKAAFDNIDLPMEIIEFIATNIISNIRELEGALIKLIAYSSLKNIDINLDLAKIVLKDVLTSKKKDISIEEIQRVVCEYFHIPDDLLRGKSRKQEIAFARQVAMYLTKEMTRYSLKSIGLHFGGRDHTTVIHAVNTIQSLLKTGDNRQHWNETMDLLRKKIQMASL
jgi:chromosomal replication initiator protein